MRTRPGWHGYWRNPGDAGLPMEVDWDLPPGFSDTFTSRYVDTGEVRLHAVTGGDGPPLLLVHGGSDPLVPHAASPVTISPVTSTAARRRGGRRTSRRRTASAHR